MTAHAEIVDLVERWAQAEQLNDSALLEPLLTEDFVGVGPVGFVIDRKQWLGRFGHGLVNRAFAIQDPQVREYGDAAVVVGVQAQETEANGRDSSGRFRVTLVTTRGGDGSWRLAHLHIGPLDYPGARPPAGREES